MHMLIAFLGAVAAAFWAFSYFVGAARAGKDAVGDAKGAVRGALWGRKANRRMIDQLDDPRDAGAILLYQVAAYDGAVTERQREHLVGAMRALFQADEEMAAGLFAFARMALGEVNDAANSLKKICKPIVNACTPQERAALVSALRTASTIEGPQNDIQTRLIEEVERIFTAS